MQPPTPQESVRVTRTASLPHSRHGRWEVEVLQENFVTALIGLAKPSGAVLPQCPFAGQAHLEDPPHPEDPAFTLPAGSCR